MTRYGKYSTDESGREFTVGNSKYMMLYVDISDFSSSLAIGYVGIFGFVAAEGTPQLIATPNASDTVKLVAFQGGDPQDPNPEPMSRAAATVDGYYLFCIEGPCQALCNGTGDFAVGDPLEILKNTDNFVVNGTSGTVVFDVKTTAFALEAYTTASDAAKKVWMRGGQSIPSAS